MRQHLVISNKSVITDDTVCSKQTGQSWSILPNPVGDWKHRSINKYLFWNSITLFVCGGKAVDIFLLISRILYSLLIKWDAKINPWSEMTEEGRPCWHQTWSQNSSAVVRVFSSLVHGINTASLENWLTTTRILLYLSNSGISVKSTVMSCQGPWGVGRDNNSPAGALFIAFLFWQHWQCFTYCYTCSFMPFHL